MSAANDEVSILTVASCSNVRAEHRSHVVVSGSYGGRYNAFNAAKWPVRAVIMNDAGIGKDNAGIVGLEFLDQIDLAAATADAQTCHIGDGDHMLAHGIISHVNRTAAALGCAPGQSVRDCAERMRAAAVPTAAPPPITEGARFVMRDVPGEPMLICADSIGMLQPDDAGRIVVTASHGALSGGRPDNAVPLDIYAVFFSDAGGGMDEAGIARLDDLDRQGYRCGRHVRGQRAHWRFPRAVPRRHPVARQRPGFPARRPGWHEAEGLHRDSDRGSKAIAAPLQKRTSVGCRARCKAALSVLAQLRPQRTVSPSRPCWWSLRRSVSFFEKRQTQAAAATSCEIPSDVDPFRDSPALHPPRCSVAKPPRRFEPIGSVMRSLPSCAAPVRPELRGLVSIPRPVPIFPRL